MESKILIDIKQTGEPFIFIDYTSSDDLRDKVLGRFLYESGAADFVPKEARWKPTTLHMQILWSDQEKGRVQAMIELLPTEKS